MLRRVLWFTTAGLTLALAFVWESPVRAAKVCIWQLTFLALSCAWASPAPETKLFLWKLTSPTTVVYLLGAPTVGVKDLYPLPKEIESAFDQSTFLVTENDVSDPRALQRLMREHGYYPANDSLSRHIPAETAEAANALAACLGQGDATFERVKPWLVAMTLRAQAVQASGFDPGDGVFRRFLDAAKKNGKPLLSLEPAGRHVEALAQLSDEIQGTILAESLKERAGTRERLQQELDVWRAGDLAAVERTQAERRKKPGLAEFYAKVYDEAYAREARKIAEYLKTRDRHFIVVDMGSLVGEKGLLKRLERDGVTLERIEASK